MPSVSGASTRLWCCVLHITEVRQSGLAETAKILIIHLRLHFQLLLAPVFLWGWLLAGGGWTNSVLIAFVAFHAFLYSGATAFNSYYDRDVGPVGGLENPPPVPGSLLPFSLAVQAIGCVLAMFVNSTFFIAYCAFFLLLSIAYSHPRIRLKAHTIGSLVAIGVGQGAVVFAAAWAATRGELNSIVSTDGVLGVTAAVMLILALYPITQLYQMDEDAARGDRTVAVAWGPARCFAVSIALTIVGGAAMLAEVLRRFGPGDAVLVALGLGAQLAILVWWAPRFDVARVLENYRAVMRLNVASAGALGAYLLARLAIVS
jgi:4-hydroxybenzoate polyprenyltransferase